MAKYEGIDYHVCKLDFPNLASESLILSNGDGTYTVLLNTRFPEEVLRDRLEHELRHMRADHLHDDRLSLARKEAAAEGRPLPPEPAVTTPVPLPTEWEEYVPVPGAGWDHALAWSDRMIRAGLHPPEPPPPPLTRRQRARQVMLEREWEREEAEITRLLKGDSL